MEILLLIYLIGFIITFIVYSVDTYKIDKCYTVADLIYGIGWGLLSWFTIIIIVLEKYGDKKLF